MEMPSSDIENVTLSEVLASWNRPRTDEELRDFVSTHSSRLPEDAEIE
jgi:hypothetical protein